jgi:alpha-L-fucosidase
MKNRLVCLFASLLAGFTFNTIAAEATDLKSGLYLHFGTPTFAPGNPAEQVPPERFAPTALDIKQWMRTAKQAGMSYAVLTAKHESGFCLWASQDYDYDITHSPVKTDIIAEFIAACNAEGIAPGVHYSIPDAHNEGTARSQGPVAGLYFNLIKKHITELHAKYPGLRVQIFDASARLSPAQWNELSQLVHHLNPQCVLLDRNHDPRYDYVTVNKGNGWMWSPDALLNSMDRLLLVYNQAKASGHSYLLNVGIDPSGRIPDSYVAALMDLKKRIDQGPATAPAATSGTGAKPDAAERLKKVKALYDQGLINKDDYDKKVKEIMDSL